MKAAVLRELNQPLSIEEVEPSKLGVGQVLVKVLTSSLCGAQMMEIAGQKGNAKFLPHLLGHEGCGIIKKIGAGVTKVKTGQKVVMHWMKGDGIESAFPKYNLHDKTISSGKVTTFSELSIVSENRITVVPDETPNELCSLLGCGMTTALGTINNEAKVKFGESVLIIGCGGLGLNLIQGASLASAYPIFTCDIDDDKLQKAMFVGADEVFNTKTDWPQEKFDIVIDTTGIPELLYKAVNSLSDDGRLVMVGQPKKEVRLDLNKLFGTHGKQIIATQGGGTIPQIDIPRYARMHSIGMLSTKGIISHRFPLEKINDAVNMLKSGHAGRIIIDIDD